MNSAAAPKTNQLVGTAGSDFMTSTFNYQTGEAMAINAARAADEEGLVPGWGVILPLCLGALEKLDAQLNEEYGTAILRFNHPHFEKFFFRINDHVVTKRRSA